MCLRRVIVLFRKATRRHCAEDAGQMARNAGSAMREEHSGKSAQCVVAPGGKNGLIEHGVLAVGLVGCGGLHGGLTQNMPVHIWPEQLAAHAGEFFQLRAVFSRDSIQPPLINHLVPAQRQDACQRTGAANAIHSLLQCFFGGCFIVHGPIMG